MSTTRQFGGPPVSRRALRCQDERGAILVHVAVAFVGLLGFSVLTIDLGVVWVARTQAQNAADAGALAGSVSLAYVEPGNTDAAGEAARAVAMANPVWGQTIGPDVASVACPAGVPTPGPCTEVNVALTAANGTALPVYFAPLLSLSSGDVSARATAQATLANETTCLRPWAIPDQWFPDTPPLQEFNPGDGYIPPDQNGPGTGYTITGSMGTEIVIHASVNPAVVNRDWFLTLNLGGGGYEANISGCVGTAIAVGSPVQADAYATMSTFIGINDLIAQDPGATWGANGIQGSAFAVSPRIVAIALYDPSTAMAPYPLTVEISNIAGLFVDEVQGGGTTIRGHLMALPGTLSQTAPQLTDASTFLRAVTLVR